VYATVVKLDTLADAVGTTAQHHHLATITHGQLIGGVVGGVVVGGVVGHSAHRDRTVAVHQAHRSAPCAEVRLRHIQQRG